MFEWKHPKYYKELRKNNLTKQNLFDKEEEDIEETADFTEEEIV